jgi:predicted dehydrogenase
MTPTGIDRRTFLRSAATAGAAFTIVPRHVLGRGHRAPSDTLNIACIGVGGMGTQDVRGVSGENIYALCDVDERQGAESFLRFPDAKRFTDFRELLDREGDHIDAVTVSTPDHTHAVAAMRALGMRKPVFCQKPLARLMGEVRALKAAARTAGVPTQMGNQGHANDGTRVLREWVEAGAIGTVREIHYWTNRPIWPQGLERPLEKYHVPAHLDWDLWLGPVPDRPYHPAYAPFRWRGWWDFGTGALGDIACHAMDAAFWILDLGLPARVIPESSPRFEESAPSASRVTYEFPARRGRSAVTVIWRDGSFGPPRPPELREEERWPLAGVGGQFWVGDDGTILADAYAENRRHLDPERDRELEESPPAEVYERSPGVYEEWLQACRGGPPPHSTFDGHAGPLTEMVLLGCLAVRAGRTLEIDPATGAVTNVELPREWVEPVYRDGWSL